jgi:lysozyme family protein
MRRIYQIAEEIVAREGGFVNDPDDPGGATKHGVTIHTMRRLGLDLNGDKVVDISDVKRLTRAQAVEIFVDHYFIRPGLDKLPEILEPSVFDMYVNAGNNAIRVLQRLLNDMGHRLAVDGILGPNTIFAATAAAEVALRHIADAYGIARRNYYYDLADRRESSRKYAKRRDGGKGGWITRAEEFISPRYRLTPSEHAARVASWG